MTPRRDFRGGTRFSNDNLGLTFSHVGSENKNSYNWQNLVYEERLKISKHALSKTKNIGEKFPTAQCFFHSNSFGMAINSNSFFKSFSSSNFIEYNKSNPQMRDLIYRPTFEMVFLKSLLNTSSSRFNKLNRDEGVFNLGIEKTFDTSNAFRFQSFNFPLFSINMHNNFLDLSLRSSSIFFRNLRSTGSQSEIGALRKKHATGQRFD